MRNWSLAWTLTSSGRIPVLPEKCLADELADLLLPVPPHIIFPPETVVTWVPMPETRRRERCIDHGKVLAEAVATRLNLTCRPLLFRLNANDKTQASLGRQAREANLSRAFAASEKIAFPVLLVDDVLTTGTTARRCDHFPGFHPGHGRRFILPVKYLTIPIPGLYYIVWCAAAYQTRNRLEGIPCLNVL